MKPGMPAVHLGCRGPKEAKAPKLYLGVHARLVFPDPRDAVHLGCRGPKEALFLPLLGREVPRDLSPLKPILYRGRGGREA